MKRARYILLAVLILFLGFLVYWARTSGSSTGSNAPHLEALVASTSGTVTILHADGKTDAAAVGMKLADGDEIWTRDTGEASLEFYAGSRTALWNNTKLKIERTSVDPNDWKKQVVHLDLESGRIWSRILKLLDLDSAYTVTANNVIASVRGTAFQAGVDGPITQLDQFDGTLNITGDATGTLYTGLSTSLNTTQHDLTVNTNTVYFTPDQTRNDHWLRAQLREDAAFAQRGETIRKGAGIDEDDSHVGNEAGPFTMDQPGAEHTFEGVNIDVSNVKQPVACNTTFQLKAIALLQKKDGTLEQRDVTNDALWQVNDPDAMKVDKGQVTVSSTSDLSQEVIARWNDGTHEHSGTFNYRVQPCLQAGNATGTMILNSSATFMINGKPLN